jgi:CRP-like cAMP-binding protein
MADSGEPVSEFMAVLCADQMQSWERGDPVRVEHYLQQYPNLASDQAVLLDLIYQEIYLCQLYGEAIDEAKLRDRFPQLAADISLLLEIHIAIDESNPSDLLASHFSAAEDQPAEEQSEPELSEYPHAKALENSFPFSELPLLLRRRLSKTSQQRVFQSGELLVKQGDAADSMMIVTAGEVKVSMRDNAGEQHLLNRLKPFSIIGEIGLMTGQPRSADVEAVGEVTALEIPNAAFEEIAQEYPAASALVSQQVALRIGTANRDVLCGRSINNYHVIQRCGRGSMGVVYEARCLSDDQPVALKMMRHDMVYDPQAMMRFHQEADILKQIDHPHCVKLLDDFPALNTMFLVLEFCDGPSLSDVIKSESPMPAEQVRPMIGQLAGALLHAHQLGIIHRDVKPANVLCTGANTVKLTDFGLARAAIDSSLTSAGQIVGTPRYMSNEQLTGSEIDARSDVFALGCIAYEMLLGRPLFSAIDLLSLLQQRALWQMPSREELEFEIPTDLYDLLAGSLASDPDQREVQLTDLLQWADN